MVVYQAFVTFQRAVLGVFSPSAIMPPCTFQSHRHLTQTVILLGGCPELSSASLVFLPSKRQLAARVPSPTRALSLCSGKGMEALLKVGNKSPPKPQIPAKACNSFTFIGVE